MKFPHELLQDTDRLGQVGLDVLLNLLIALAIFIVGKWLASALIKLTRAAMHRARVDETLADFLANVLYGIAIAVIVLAGVGTLGVDTTSAAAVLGGAALAIGLSLQSQLSSLAAGVVIILFRPFSKGDLVEIGGVKGVVEEIKIVSTQLRSPENKQVIVPNSSITTNIITNYTARSTRKLDLTVGIAYDADLRRAKQALEELMAADPRVLKDPAPLVQVKALAEHAVQFSIQPWSRTSDAADLEASLLEAIKLRFDADGLPLAQRRFELRLERDREAGV